MKILQVVPYFSPAWAYGGTPKVAFGLAKALARAGHEVEVFTTDAFDGRRRNPWGGDKVDVEGMKVSYFRNLSNKLAFDHRLFLSPGVVWAARRELKRFDVIHLHEYRTLQNFIVSHYAKKYRIPYVLSAHGSLPRFSRKRGSKKIFDLVFGRRILEDAAGLVAIREEEAQQYKLMGANAQKIRIVPNGLDVGLFQNLPEKGRFKKEFGLQDRRIILFLGRINVIKGLDFLVRAFNQVQKELEDVVLVLAGPDDGYKRTLLKLIEKLNLTDKVIFVDFLEEERKLSAYVDAEVLVYPSLHEVFGLVPFEAAMCGTPVLVTESSGCAGVFKKIGVDNLVRYGDVVGLERKIVNVLSHLDPKREDVQKIRKYVVDNLNWSVIVEKMVNVYQEVVEER
ncbi:glycosyltransferase [Candidatus Hakubella thermalkaliphila]|uniref:Glycosyltransferase n=1 Tax=Candidatus Hakubella thermalkaliphila TaxID=2754717 RepID=A0A6V8P816_9ACTN|nr:glycosyltransferase [Candidatus Hakubella thermalkaliphila]GFP26916.1 hypothetical protein HKBW3S33_00329 [Candidatus Hakubella thermalkaliphila]